MKNLIITLSAASLLISGVCANAQAQKAATINDTNTPLHLLQPDYKVPYGVPAKAAVKADLDRVLKLIDAGTPYGKNAKPGTFRLTSYEWGVTYQATLKAGEVTGDKAYTNYTVNRHKYLASEFPAAKKAVETGGRTSFRSVADPHALDDAGAICTSMIKDQIANPSLDLRPMIDNFVNYIYNKEYRLTDGTLARMRPLENAVWLDDMFMGIPALAWYGRLTGDTKYYNEAIRQVKLFAEKMWVPETNLFRHGWIESMEYHPAFYWGRANGWAILTMTEVLDAVPEGYPGRDFVLDLYKKHTIGLITRQSSEGFWHQLLDRSDSYLETSATAIYAYCLAHGINEGWLNALTYGPVVCLAWNAIATMIDEEGKVNGTCVGTGMGFDPAFYYYRPISPFAAHGYGPVIFAGAEVIRMVEQNHPAMNDSAVHFYNEDMSGKGAIFSVVKK